MAILNRLFHSKRDFDRKNRNPAHWISIPFLAQKKIQRENCVFFFLCVFKTSVGAVLSTHIELINYHGSRFQV